MGNVFILRQFFVQVLWVESSQIVILYLRKKSYFLLTRSVVELIRLKSFQIELRRAIASKYCVKMQNFSFCTWHIVWIYFHFYQVQDFFCEKLHQTQKQSEHSGFAIICSLLCYYKRDFVKSELCLPTLVLNYFPQLLSITHPKQHILSYGS